MLHFARLQPVDAEGRTKHDSLLAAQEIVQVNLRGQFKVAEKKDVPRGIIAHSLGNVTRVARFSQMTLTDVGHA